MCPYNPAAEELGGLEVFLYEAAQNFELFSNIQDQNLKKSSKKFTRKGTLWQVFICLRWVGGMGDYFLFYLSAILN